jgi:hypothetical protein
MSEVYAENEIHYICDKCGSGKMISHSPVFCVLTFKILYRSICDEIKCKFEYNMLREYPIKLEKLYD